MQDGVYNVIEIIGTSKTSWEDAAANAVATAAKTIEDLRVAEVTEFDLKLDGITNKVVAYRVKVRLSFKYHKH